MDILQASKEAEKLYSNQSPNFQAQPYKVSNKILYKNLIHETIYHIGMYTLISRQTHHLLKVKIQLPKKNHTF